MSEAASVESTPFDLEQEIQEAIPEQCKNCELAKLMADVVLRELPENFAARKDEVKNKIKEYCPKGPKQPSDSISIGTCGNGFDYDIAPEKSYHR